MNIWTPENLQQHLESGNSIFLKLWKNGCGACKLSVPAVERLEAANEHGLIFGQINAEDHPEILEIADTDVLPVFFVFVKKEQKGRFEGFKGIEKLKKMVDDCFTA
jgi:thioredoxin-like negative regulator of GroEL